MVVLALPIQHKAIILRARIPVSRVKPWKLTVQKISESIHSMGTQNLINCSDRDSVMGIIEATQVVCLFVLITRDPFHFDRKPIRETNVVNI